MIAWLFSQVAGAPEVSADCASKASRWALVAVASLSSSGRIRVRLSPVRVTLDWPSDRSVSRWMVPRVFTEVVAMATPS
ncbi:hypothetical protein D3C80_1270290 [compost metagenome]